VKPDKAVAAWLFILCFMVFGLVAGGGHARTIGAGFAIQTWAPFTGFIPPLGAADWARQFALFQQTAQYQAHPISLAVYKSLFWPMFLDRCWGRLMALVFLLPFGFFLWRRRISLRLAAWLLAIFALGGAQALFGWLMVETGLRPGTLTPPPAYAATHFCTAMLIFSALFWTALTVRNPAPAGNAGFLRPWLTASIALILSTMALGALVAATNAISVFNTFPLMDGQLVPLGLLGDPQAVVQFFHRMLATLTVLAVLTTSALGLRAEPSPGLRDLLLALAGLVALQFLLGMVTLVLDAPELGYVHELNAVFLLSVALAARHEVSGRFFEKKLRKKLLLRETSQNPV
jgi:cytochrome c oxidase assembly protein subunit 15